MEDKILHTLENIDNRLERIEKVMNKQLEVIDYIFERLTHINKNIPLENNFSNIESQLKEIQKILKSSK